MARMNRDPAGSVDVIVNPAPPAPMAALRIGAIPGPPRDAAGPGQAPGSSSATSSSWVHHLCRPRTTHHAGTIRSTARPHLPPSLGIGWPDRQATSCGYGRIA
jgi:hypothetical protein